MTHIYDWNERLGMGISTLNNQLCVELDTGSLFSDYSDYLSEFNDTLTQNETSITEVLYTQQSYSELYGLLNAYRKGEGITIRNNANQVQ